MVFSKGKIFLVMCEKEILTVIDWKFHPNTEQMVPPLPIHLSVSQSYIVHPRTDSGLLHMVDVLSLHKDQVGNL